MLGLELNHVSKRGPLEFHDVWYSVLKIEVIVMDDGSLLPALLFYFWSMHWIHLIEIKASMSKYIPHNECNC